MAEYWESLQNLFETHIAETDQLRLEVVDSCTLCSVLLTISGLIGLLVLGVAANRWKQRKAAKAAQLASAPEPMVPKLVRLDYNWTIDNFLACDLITNAEFIDSAPFNPPGYPKERFQLRIYPRAGSDGQEVSLYLRYVPLPEEVIKAQPAAIPAEGETPTPAPAVQPPVEPSPARVQFVCRIVTPKELKADIKPGDCAGWTNFITREALLNYLDGTKKSKLQVHLQGHFVATK